MDGGFYHSFQLPGGHTVHFQMMTMPAGAGHMPANMPPGAFMLNPNDPEFGAFLQALAGFGMGGHGAIPE